MNTLQLNAIEPYSLPSWYVMPGLNEYVGFNRLRVINNGIVFDFSRTVSVETNITLIVSKVFGMPIETILFRTRKRQVVFPRQSLIYLYLLTDKSTKTISSLVRLKNHATVIHTRKKINYILETKYPYDDYSNIVRALQIFNTLYPQYSLSKLPRGWDNPTQRIHKS